MQDPNFQDQIEKKISVGIQMFNLSSLDFLNFLIAAFALHIRVISEGTVITDLCRSDGHRIEVDRRDE